MNISILILYGFKGFCIGSKEKSELFSLSKPHDIFSFPK